MNNLVYSNSHFMFHDEITKLWKHLISIKTVSEIAGATRSGDQRQISWENFTRVLAESRNAFQKCILRNRQQRGEEKELAHDG